MKIYEIQYTKEYIGEELQPHKTGLKVYQVPSDHEYNALVKFGQIMNNEDYKIDILYIHQVTG